MEPEAKKDFGKTIYLVKKKEKTILEFGIVNNAPMRAMSFILALKNQFKHVLNLYGQF